MENYCLPEFPAGEISLCTNDWLQTRGDHFCTSPVIVLTVGMDSAPLTCSTQLPKDISGRKKARNASAAWCSGHLLGGEATTWSCWAVWRLGSESLHGVRALDTELPVALSGSVFSQLNYKFLSETNQHFLQELIVYTAIKSEYCDTHTHTYSSLIYAITWLELN